MTQEQDAKKIGISQAQLSRVLNCKTRPSWNTAKKLSKYFGTSPILWMEGTPEEIKKAISNTV